MNIRIALKIADLFPSGRYGTMRRIGYLMGQTYSLGVLANGVMDMLSHIQALVMTMRMGTIPEEYVVDAYDTLGQMVNEIDQALIVMADNKLSGQQGHWFGRAVKVQANQHTTLRSMCSMIRDLPFAVSKCLDRHQAEYLATSLERLNETIVHQYLDRQQHKDLVNR